MRQFHRKATMAKKGKIEVNQEFCKACELCVANCPAEAIRLSTHFNNKGYQPAEPVPEKCTGCGLCALMCPEGAIEVWRE